MYQPAPGDRVTVTRTAPDGRTYRSSGTITAVSERGLGFALAKDGGTCSWYADAATMHARYGVVQTITPAPDTTPEEGPR